MKQLSLYLTLMAGILITTGSMAQSVQYTDAWSNEGFSVRSQQHDGMEIDFSIHGLHFSDIILQGEKMTEIGLPGSFLFNDEGYPNLPGNGRLIAIPNGSVPRLRILEMREEVMPGMDIAPAPRIPKENESGPLQQEKNPLVYTTDAFYPSEPVNMSSPMEIRGVKAVMLGITPFRYNPVTKELRIIRDLRISISFEGGNGQYGEERLRSRFWDPILEDALLNFNNLPQVDYNARLQQMPDNAGYEYLIITPNGSSFTAWADSIRRFRIQQGITTVVKTLAEVGGNTTTAIESYINTAYNTWNPAPAAVLLLGDYGTDANSTVISPIYNSYCVSDNIYGDVTGDHLPEISMARITANNAAQLQVMVTKFLNYERNPPTSANFYDHPISALGWQTERWFQICSEATGGFWKYAQLKNPVRINEIYSGTPGSVWSTATNTNTVVNYFGPNGQNYIPAQPGSMPCCWTGGNATQINSAINSGAFCLLHRDHGMETGWGEPYYTNSSINGLTNVNNQLPFIFSINCLTGKYNYSSETFTEKFHRYTYSGQNSGALGLIAASEVSYSFVNDTYLWGMMDNFWPDFMPTYGTSPASRGFMPCFGNSAGKIYLFSSSWPYNTNNKTVTYNLFHHHGDAFSMVYSEVPQTLTVNHNNTINAGTTVFQVSANPGSFIALSLDDQLLGIATGTGNPVDITIPGTLVNGQMMRVTITLQNFFRYNAMVPVVPNGGPMPDFSADSTALCAGLSVDFTDLSSGNPISWSWTFPGGTPGSSNLQNPQDIVYNTPGTYNVSLVATNNISSNTLTKTAYITVNTPATISTPPAGDTLLCQNNPTSLYTAPVIPGASVYSWELIPVGAGTISVQDNQCYVDWEDTYTGIATLRVQATNGCGTSPFSPAATITLRPFPATPGTPVGEIHLCKGQTYMNLYTTEPVANANHYDWKLEPVTAGSVTGTGISGTVTWNPGFAGTALVSVRAVNECFETLYSTPLAVTITPLPLVQLGPDTVLTIYQTLLLDAGNPGADYQWSNGATTQTILAAFSSNSAETYSVEVLMNGCAGNDTIKVTFNDPVGVDQKVKVQSILVKPNPNHGQFTLQLSENQEGKLSLSLLNTMGEELYNAVHSPGWEPLRDISMDVRGIPDGIYYLVIDSEKGRETIKIVIIR